MGNFVCDVFRLFSIEGSTNSKWSFLRGNLYCYQVDTFVKQFV